VVAAWATATDLPKLGKIRNELQKEPTASAANASILKKERFALWNGNLRMIDPPGNKNSKSP
jgi:hypothetical protein